MKTKIFFSVTGFRNECLRVSMSPEIPSIDSALLLLVDPSQTTPVTDAPQFSNCIIDLSNKF